MQLMAKEAMKLKMSVLFNKFILNKNNINPEYPNFWNQKYNNNDAQWDTGAPTPIFVNWSKTLKNSRKKILIPGCGKGHDAIFLARKNHDIYAVDFSSKAISFLKKKSKENKVSLNAICKDFFQLNQYYGEMDIILEYTFFCAINPNLRLKYIKETSRLLKNGGLFVALLLPINKNINEGGPPYGLELDKTIKQFEKYYKVLQCKKSHLSIKPRLDSEIFVIMRKI